MQMNCEVIGIDHGFGATKTANCIFKSGVVASENESYTNKDVLKFKGKYYVCGTGRQGLTKDKTEDENYYILTLVAIAKEIEYRGLPRNLDVIIAAGLPLTSFGREKENFKKYLTPAMLVKFVYEMNEYKINIKDVMLYPQGYTAIASDTRLLKSEPSLALIDVGSWTVDCMLINNQVPDASGCRSLEYGMIRCIEQIQEESRRSLGLQLTPAQIEQVLQGKPCSMDNKRKELILIQGEKYTNELMKMLKESGFDSMAIPTILMGGGAMVINSFLPKGFDIRIIDDIHANAKGYESIAKQVLEDER
jgi:plasmid segregation protein ParM